MRSIRNLSISASWPARSSCTRLPLSRARSRTTNGIRRKISPTGTSRTRITPSRRSRSCRSMPRAVVLQRAPFLERHVRLDALQRVLEPGPRHDHVADQAHRDRRAWRDRRARSWWPPAATMSPRGRSGAGTGGRPASVGRPRVPRRAGLVAQTRRRATLPAALRRRSPRRTRTKSPPPASTFGATFSTWPICSRRARTRVDLHAALDELWRRHERDAPQSRPVAG